MMIRAGSRDAARMQGFISQTYQNEPTASANLPNGLEKSVEEIIFRLDYDLGGGTF